VAAKKSGKPGVGHFFFRGCWVGGSAVRVWQRWPFLASRPQPFLPLGPGGQAKGFQGKRADSFGKRQIIKGNPGFFPLSRNSVWGEKERVPWGLRPGWRLGPDETLGGQKPLKRPGGGFLWPDKVLAPFPGKPAILPQFDGSPCRRIVTVDAWGGRGATYLGPSILPTL